MDEARRWGVFTKDKAPRTLRAMALDADRRHHLLPRERQGAPARHDRQPARLVHQPPAQLGRAAALLPAQGIGRTAPGHDGDPRPRGGASSSRAASKPGAASRPKRSSAPPTHRTTPRAATSSRSGSTRARPSSTCCAARTQARRRHRAPRRAGPEADLYLEGHDQHRGWFHSSLLLGCALEGRAPYRGLLTHGFTVDGQGRKMSKSLGNIIEIRDVRQDPGAEIVRLWCASTDYAGDPPIDDKILARVVDSYRRIRNTLRFLLANIADFDADARRGAGRRDARDRPLGAGARGPVAGRDAGALRALRVPPGGRQAAAVLQRRPGRVLPRRAEGPALHHRAEVAGAALARRPRCGTSRTRCCAGWRRSCPSPPRKPGRSLAPGQSPSIFTETYWRFDAPDEALLAKWQRIREIRDEVNKEIEAVRTAGEVGSSLQADVDAHGRPRPITRCCARWATT